jgi:hypothetical protein
LETTPRIGYGIVPSRRRDFNAVEKIQSCCRAGVGGRRWCGSRRLRPSPGSCPKPRPSRRFTRKLLLPPLPRAPSFKRGWSNTPATFSELRLCSRRARARREERWRVTPAQQNGVLSFLARLPFAREPLRFGDLCRRHICGEGIPEFRGVFVAPGSPQV